MQTMSRITIVITSNSLIIFMSVLYQSVCVYECLSPNRSVNDIKRFYSERKHFVYLHFNNHFEAVLPISLVLVYTKIPLRDFEA